MDNDLWQPIANYVLVSVPERFSQRYAVGTKRLYMPAGSDDWAATTEALKLGFGTATEADESAHQTRVQTGSVLAVPRSLTTDMVICSGLGTMEVKKLEGVFDEMGRHVKHRSGRDVFRENGTYTANRPKTAADIQEPVAVGDTVYFEADYLDDEHEVSPGVYRLPYSALICRIEKTETISPVLKIPEQITVEAALAFFNQQGMIVGDGFGESFITIRPALAPIGGYVLLTRVWADDVVPESEGSTLKCRKRGDMIVETNVPPLPNEGTVAWIGKPLRGTADDIEAGQRVIFQAGHALIETICGTEYVVVRHEYCLAVKQPFTQSNTPCPAN